MNDIPVMLSSGQVHMLMRSLRYFAQQQRAEALKASKGPDTPGNRHLKMDGVAQANAAEMLLGKLRDAMLRKPQLPEAANDDGHKQ